MRHFIRYSVDIPVEITLGNNERQRTENVKNVSTGGLCVSMANCPGLGSRLLIRIPYLDPPFETRMEVAWCLKKGDHYDVGLRMLDPDDTFRVRMVEQICHIEHYRNEVLAVEGRHMTAEQAAMEWIENYSSVFPNLEYGHSNIRRFIRHPTDIRIETTLLGLGNVYIENAHDVGLGGLRLSLPVCPDPGSDLNIKTLCIEPPFEASGRVVWCNPRNDRYDVGIELTRWRKKDWLRVVDQICEIEKYRRSCRQRNGCRLRVAQAAKDWYAQRAKMP